jgi:hypothetical protein
MSVTLRVYDSAKRNKKYENYIDRYSLYVPTPRNKVKEWGIMGTFLGFSFSDKGITRCCWDECKQGVAFMNLGKKIKRDTLPKHVQEWVEYMENTYNRALKEDTEEAWDEWNRV